MKIYIDALSKGPTVSIGTQALIIASMEIIKKNIPDAEFVMLSAFPEYDRHYLDREPYKIKLVKREAGVINTIKTTRLILKEVDLVVSAWGDGYITTPPHKIINKTLFLKGRHKPLLLFPSSIGSFKGGLQKALVRFGLGSFDSVMIRDTITFDYLKQLKVKNMSLIPDTAFILLPADSLRANEILSAENAPEQDSYIGINVSNLLLTLFTKKLRKDYALFISEIIEYLSANFKKHILLIPHQINFLNDVTKGFSDSASYHGDDRYAVSRIMEFVKDKSKVTPITGDYSCREYKAIINRCELFIGGRMHTVIAAISQAVPSVLMQYSHKATGVMDLVDMQSYVWDFQSSREELYNKINEVWHNRNRLHSNLADKMQTIKKQTWKAGEILKEVIERYKINDISVKTQ